MASPVSPRAAFGALVSLSALILSACGGPRSTPAEDVHRFLTAVAADDRAAFDALVDRPAVRADLRRQIATVARAEQVEIEGGPSDFALDRMVSPATLRLVEAAEGRVEPPAPADLKVQLKILDSHSICLPAADNLEACRLTFRRDKNGPYRLSGMLVAATPPIAPQE